MRDAVPPADDAARFVDAFHQVFVALHRRQESTERPLSLEATGMLEHLAATGPLTIREAAQHFGRSQSATSEIVRRVARRGLVRTFADERDRRRTLVWFTADGLDRWRASRRVLDEARVTSALEALSKPRRRAVIAALEAIATAATPPPAPLRRGIVRRP